MKKRIYKVNPFCTNCGEEHAWYKVCITEEEQKLVDKYYEERNDKINLMLALEELEQAPLAVKGKFKCPVCGAVFESKVGIYRSFNEKFHLPNSIPAGVYPVFGSDR